jgi:hypothetical protein
VKRITKQSSSGAGRGRLRLTILLASMAALLLVPVAQAFANGTMTVVVEGEGAASGEVTGVQGNLYPLGQGEYEGVPPVECSNIPGEEKEVCETELVEESAEPGIEGASVHANPGPGSEFAGWQFAWTGSEGFTEGCSETGESVYRGACTAYVETGTGGAFAVATFRECSGSCPALTVSKAGTGTGTVTGRGIHCGTECSNEYAHGVSVPLKAEPQPGSEFTGWSNCEVELSGGECRETMNSAHSVTATFNLEPVAGPPLTLKVEEGSGTVVSNPAGLECTKSAGEECTTEAVEAGSVVLTASPASGYLFKSWKGCEVVNGRQCTINLTAAKTVGVKFVKAWSLAGTKSINQGIFSTSPGGVNCGYGCLSSSALYKEGSLTLKAKPAKHFHFVEFSGGTNSAASCNSVTAETCTIASFSSNSAIEEVYAADATHTLSLSKEGGGQGFVKTKPTAINCGYTCTAASGEFFFNEEAPVTVTLNKGTTSVTWTTGAGTCTGNALSCSVPMSGDHTLVAKFE